MAVAGTLEIQMAANLARLSKDMSEAKGVVGGAMRNIEGAVSSAKSVLATLGLGAGVGGILLIAKNSIDAAAALDDMAESTGASVAEISKLSQQARISGVEMTLVEQTLQRLSRSLNGTDEESKKATRALNALGLSAEELRGKDTAQALKIVADAMNQFGDSSGKTALAMDLLGKSGAQMLPFLKDLANDAELAASVTAEQAAQAEELGKVIRRLSNDFDVLKTTVLLGVLPGLMAWIDANREAIRIGGGVTEMLRLFVFHLDAMTAEKPGEEIRRLKKEIVELGEELQKPWWRQGALQYLFGEGALEDKRKQIELLKFLQRQEALALGGTDSPGERQRFGLAGVVKPKLDYDPEDSPDAQRRREREEAKRIADMERAEKERLAHLKRLEKIDADHWVRRIEEQFKFEADEEMRKHEKVIRDEKKREQDLENIRTSLLTEEELEKEAYVRRLSVLIEANETGMISDGEMKAMREAMEEQHQKRIYDIVMRGTDKVRKWEVMSAEERTKAVISELMNMTAGVAHQSRAMFEINKIASIANAVMKGYESVVNSYAFGSRIGGPVLGGVMAAIAAAATFAQISAIRSTTFGGGGAAPSVAGTTAAPPVSLAQPAPSPLSGQGQTQRREVVIQINSSRSIFTRDDLEQIMDGMSEIAADGFPTRFTLSES